MSLPTARATRVRYGTLGWLTLAAVLAYLPRNAVGVAESTIREDLGLTLQQSGWFMGAFFWTYALFQVPGGFLAQRFGTRNLLPILAMSWSIAALGIGVAPVFLVLIAAQLTMGLAQAGLFPAATNSIGHWIPLTQRSLACGILAAGMQVGAIAASGLTGTLLEPLGWRLIFMAYAVPGIIWSAFFFRRFRNHPDQSARVNAAERELIEEGKHRSETKTGSQENPQGGWIEILGNRSIWFLCAQQICRAAGYMFFASWFPTFLQQTRDVSVEKAGYLQGLVLLGTLAGAILGGMIVDWIWRRTRSFRLSRGGVGATALAICGALILGAWFVQSAVWASVLLAVGALTAGLAGPCAYTSTIDIGGERVPQVFGLMNMCGNLAAAACPVLVASLFEWTSNWNVVLLVFAGIYLIGSVCWLFVNPQRRIDPV